MLRIGQFSKLGKTTIKTLRYYDKIGLLKPSMIDKASSYRYYTEEQLERLHQICAYKSAGLSNACILALLGDGKNEHAVLEEQKKLLLAKEEEIKQALSNLESLLSGEGKQEYTATLKAVDARLVYCCSGYVTDQHSIHDFMKSCSEELKKTNPEVKFSEPDYCCVIYPDDGYRESNIFIEYAQSVDRAGKDTEFLKFKRLDGITAISVLHYGSYHTLKDAYLFAIGWIKENGYELCGEARERYINGSWNKESVAEWLTELQLPVRKSSSL